MFCTEVNFPCRPTPPVSAPIEMYRVPSLFYHEEKAAEQQRKPSMAVTGHKQIATVEEQTSTCNDLPTPKERSTGVESFAERHAFRYTSSSSDLEEGFYKFSFGMHLS